MSNPTQPSEIAREVLRQLAMRRQLPTPDNYAALYNEIAGSTAVEAFPEKSLKTIAASLPRSNTDQMRLARQLETAITDKNWNALKDSLQAFANAAATEPLQWSGLIRELIGQLERGHAKLTPAKKREAIEHQLQSAATPDLLFSRLQSLLRAWAQGLDAADLNLVDNISPASVPSTDSENKPQTAAPTGTSAPVLNRELQEWIALLLENSISALLIDSPDLLTEAAQLAADIRAIRTSEAKAGFSARLKKFSYRLQFLVPVR